MVNRNPRLGPWLEIITYALEEIRALVGFRLRFGASRNIHDMTTATTSKIRALYDRGSL